MVKATTPAWKKPPWQRENIGKDEGFARLETATISDATQIIIDGVAAYEDCIEKVAAMRKTIEWMFAGPESAERFPLSFDTICADADCDPDIVRDKMLAGVPQPLQRIVFHGKDFDCPLMGRTCTAYSPKAT